MISPFYSLALVALSLFVLGTPTKVLAQDTPTGFVDLTFSGTVEYARGDAISVRNPDGSFTTFSSDSIPAYLYEPGATLTITFRFDGASSAFSNSACGGRYTLTSVGSAGTCGVETQVITPFGPIGMGGTGGDSIPSIVGLDLLRDATTGQYSVEMPNGSYSFRYVGVNPYYYDSASQTLSGPNSNRCVNVFDCPASSGAGDLGLLSFLIPIAGDFGLIRPGYNVGYYAGDAGSLNIRGSFSFGGATAVPEPDMGLLFGGTALVLAYLRRRRIRYA